MTATTYLWNPPPIHSLPVLGRSERLPINRLFFVGRNYHAHAVEMGRPVDKSVEVPFYFTKAPSTLVESGATVPYPPGTRDYQHEMELVVAIGATGFRVSEADAHQLIYGYACGLDMTRRDLQLVAREKGRPWDLGKDVEQSSVVSQIVPMPQTVLTRGELSMAVNGEVRQKSDLSKLIWNIPELIADLSKFYHLQPGDLIFTGTPEGVGPLQAGDRIDGKIEGVGSISLSVDPAERTCAD
ncbi:2-keto-4-pentenoate hydratase/2-oxohepta-3-ene-1%2C7-dioic acid hydratase (catechol pathway) [Achromobacter sp. 2789STDY5608633]|uniref:fumarylacetoacetate hydrolase family protein n=1 Tax=Achromobacter sp. 2789STDY5608633 TaxID=1806501 RepID=UPI0006C44690|nr:fumarylacetoacetate hydrolase family protein [Achromobacter sp. 2789STDY5608633]CUJ48811.1 2-keto-4-pentenoate hydratase/2-oxohepta-3-ene-1%2C7-dioic acid hydratase (catechol pathway) [Achromobacter sp. 2789STDY5608633]